MSNPLDTSRSSAEHTAVSSRVTKNSTSPQPPTEHPLMESFRFALIAILIIVPIRLFIAQPFIVSGASMDETFSDGQYLIVDQLTYYFNDPSRGDVVIFRYPRDPSQHFIKRVIGLPGDTITIKDTVVTITNEEHPTGITIDEPYITEMSPAAPFTKILEEGQYFVMGDNRDHSSDSRAWGILPEERIVGRAWLRLIPPSNIGYLPGEVDLLPSITE